MQRARSISATLSLATGAARKAGVTRLGDVTAFAVPGVPVFQAVRPSSLSLSVSQGKGLTPIAARVSALLEAVEFWSAERIPRPIARQSLSDIDEGQQLAWVRLLEGVGPIEWIAGKDIADGEVRLLPRELISLDCTEPTGKLTGSTVGLACGNSRVECLASGLAEILEHCCSAQFDQYSSFEKLEAQLSLDTVDDPAIQLLLARIENAGFIPRVWDLGQEIGLPVFRCGLFERHRKFDAMAPVSGSGCDPDPKEALLRALLEAVQTRATLVAGARDDLLIGDYLDGKERERAAFSGALAFGSGNVEWPSYEMPCATDCFDTVGLLLDKVRLFTSDPVIVYDHPDPIEGLSLAHVICPALLDRTHGKIEHADAGDRMPLITYSTPKPRAIIYGGPSLRGLAIPDGVEVRPPAICGDFASLLADPPEVVALVDGYFGIAPTVWHKEIMGLLAAGCVVIGGASLGALRAAEMERYGMRGAGMIFRAYRDGFIRRDDAVMLVHAPEEAGYLPLSLALVDAEFALAQARITPLERRKMQRIVRTMPYQSRDWTSCLAIYEEREGRAFPLGREELDAFPSLKALDAAEVLREVEAALGSPEQQTAETAPYMTCFFRDLLATSARSSVPAPI